MEGAEAGGDVTFVLRSRCDEPRLFPARAEVRPGAELMVRRVPPGSAPQDGYLHVAASLNAVSTHGHAVLRNTGGALELEALNGAVSVAKGAGQWTRVEKGGTAVLEVGAIVAFGINVRGQMRVEYTVNGQRTVSGSTMAMTQHVDDIEETAPLFECEYCAGGYVGPLRDVQQHEKTCSSRPAPPRPTAPGPAPLAGIAAAVQALFAAAAPAEARQAQERLREHDGRLPVLLAEWQRRFKGSHAAEVAALEQDVSAVQVGTPYPAGSVEAAEAKRLHKAAKRRRSGAPAGRLAAEEHAAAEERAAAEAWPQGYARDVPLTRVRGARFRAYTRHALLCMRRIAFEARRMREAPCRIAEARAGIRALQSLLSDCDAGDLAEAGSGEAAIGANDEDSDTSAASGGSEVAAGSVALQKFTSAVGSAARAAAVAMVRLREVGGNYKDAVDITTQLQRSLTKLRKDELHRHRLRERKQRRESDQRRRRHEAQRTGPGMAQKRAKQRRAKQHQRREGRRCDPTGDGGQAYSFAEFVAFYGRKRAVSLWRWAGRDAGRHVGRGKKRRKQQRAGGGKSSRRRS